LGTREKVWTEERLAVLLDHDELMSEMQLIQLLSSELETVSTRSFERSIDDLENISKFSRSINNDKKSSDKKTSFTVKHTSESRQSYESGLGESTPRITVVEETTCGKSPVKALNRKKELQVIFGKFDQNGTGFISPEQLLFLGQRKNSAPTSLSTWTEQKNAKLIRRMDQTGNGALSNFYFYFFIISTSMNLRQSQQARIHRLFLYDYGRRQ